MKSNILKKVSNNIYNSLNKEILVTIFALNLIFSLSSYLKFINTYKNPELTYTDLVLWNLNNEILITFLFTITFLVLINRIFVYSNHQYYSILKYRNRTECLIVCFLSSFVLSILYIVGFLILYFLQAIFNMSFHTRWDEMSLDEWGIVFYKTNNPSLSSFILPNTVNLILYLILMSILFMFFFLLFNSNIGAWGMMVFIIVINFVIYKSKLSLLYSLSTLGNIILGFEQKIINDKVNMGYWLIQIMFWGFLCYRVIQKKDLIKIGR